MNPLGIDRHALEHVHELRQLNAEILELTMVISMYCPELSKYLEEMTVIDLSMESDAIQVQSLRLYFDRLFAMMAGYAIHSHPAYQA